MTPRRHQSLEPGDLPAIIDDCRASRGGAGVTPRGSAGTSSPFSGKRGFFMSWCSGPTGAALARAGLSSLLASRLAGAAAAACVLALPALAWAETPPARYETVVTASPADSAAREDDAASSSVITVDRTPRSGETLPGLLSELPGVSVTRLGGLGSLATLSVRGSAPNQVQVYLDGVPLDSATFGGVDLGGLPLGDLARIEVYRGMSPIAFGASGLGGVVALSSRVPQDSGLTVEAGGGSFGTGFAGAQARWAGRRLRLFAGLHHLGTAGDFPYPSDNGTAFDPSDDRIARRQNNALRQTDALLRAAVPAPGRRELIASLSFFQRGQGVPAYAIFQSHQAWLGTRRFLASVAYDSRDDLGPGGRLRAVLYGGTGTEEFRDPRPDIALVPTHSHDRNESAGATVTGGRSLAGWLRLHAVLDARHQRFIPSDELATSPTGPPGVRSFGAAGLEPHALIAPAALELIPSFRIEAARDAIIDQGLFGPRSAETRPSTWIQPMARLALVERPAAWLVLRANVGRYARLPTMFERYGNGGTVAANSRLRPESGINADLGATLSLTGTGGTALAIESAVFAARVHDLIQLEPGRAAAHARNVDEARVLGAELAVSGRLPGHVRLVAQATFTDARNVGGIAGYRGRQIPSRPRLRAHGRPELDRLPLPSGWRLGLYAEGDVTGGNYLDPANFERLPARVLFGAGFNLTSPAGRWRLVASGENLADSRINDLAGFPLPGRSLFFTFQWSSAADIQPREITP
jgi:outer membrane cobalamin receptor